MMRSARLSRSLTDSPFRRSAGVEARTGQLPKLTVRLSFASGGASGSRMDRDVPRPGAELG